MGPRPLSSSRRLVKAPPPKRVYTPADEPGAQWNRRGPRAWTWQAEGLDEYGRRTFDELMELAGVGEKNNEEHEKIRQRVLRFMQLHDEPDLLSVYVCRVRRGYGVPELASFVAGPRESTWQWAMLHLLLARGDTSDGAHHAHDHAHAPPPPRCTHAPKLSSPTLSSPTYASVRLQSRTSSRASTP